MGLPFANLNRDQIYEGDPNLLFAGTPEELVNRLSLADSSFAEAPIPADVLCGFIESNVTLLRGAAIEAVVERTGSETRIVLRSLAPEITGHRSDAYSGSVIQSPLEERTAGKLERSAVGEFEFEESEEQTATFVGAVDPEIEDSAKTLMPQPPEGTTASPRDNFKSSFPWLTESADERLPRNDRRQASADPGIESWFEAPAVSFPTPSQPALVDPVPDVPAPKLTLWLTLGACWIGLVSLFVLGWGLIDNFKSSHLVDTPALIDDLAAGRPVNKASNSKKSGGTSREATPSPRSESGDGKSPAINEPNLNTLFHQASVEQSPAAQYRLGKAYAEGRDVKRDVVTAYIWLVLARSNGDPDAETILRGLAPQLTNSDVKVIRLALANMYLRGVGVKPDQIAAYIWLNLAQAAGASEAAAKKRELEATMTPDQIASANARSDEFLKNY